jgi:hypothetical protein
VTVSLAGLLVIDGGEFAGGGLGESGGVGSAGGEEIGEAESIFAPGKIPEHPDVNKTGIVRSV